MRTGRLQLPKLTSLPNLVTGLRLGSIPVIWAFAVAGNAVVVGAGVFFGWLTDALDGFLARALDAESAWGSRLDSLADTLLFVSALAWVAMLRPEFIQEHWLPLATWLAIGSAGYLMGWMRFRKIADTHLYSGKAANFVGLTFAAVLLIFDSYPPAVFYAVIAVCIWASTEMLLVFAISGRVDASIRTVFHVQRRGRS